jgi:superfamily II DNA or RNA helicase
VAAPTWRDLLPEPSPAADSVPLALGVELRRLESRASHAWQPRRAETVTPRALTQRTDSLLVGLRPMMRSPRTGAWIKGDVSWDALRRPGGPHDPRLARWFAELHSLSREIRSLGPFTDVSEWITLDTVSSALLWTHLGLAAGLGIPLIGTTKHLHVTLASVATLSMAAEPRAEGGLTLSAEVAVDGQSVDVAAVRPVARSGIYAFAVRPGLITLTLAPLALGDAGPALLGAPGGIRVPASEAAEFVRDHLPRLARRVDVVPRGGLELPAAGAPVLVVCIAFRPEHTIDVRLEWEYAGLDRVPWDADAEADRDEAGEADLRARAEAAWRESGTSSPLEPGTLRGIASAEFIAHTVPALEALDGVRIERTGTPRRYTELTGAPEITVTTVESTDPDWFDLGVIVTIDGRRIPFAPLFTALSRRRTKLLLADGRYFSLAHPALDRLRELLDEAATLSEWETAPRISRHQVDLWADFEDLADQAEPAVSWRATAQGLRDVERIEPTPVPSSLRADLRPYQRAGFDWLAFLWRHRLGGILADDMGLGKTLQMLALIVHANEAGEPRPFLVVAPTSVMSVWRTEAERFAPGLRVQTVDATRTKSGRPIAPVAASADVVITSYTLVRLDESEFGTVEWAAVILDEAQFVKNAQTRQHRAVRDLRAPLTFAVTGTPLENSLTELWALLSLTAPGLFPSARRFREQYVQPIELGKVPENEEGGPFRAARLARLRRRIRPLVLRRTKELVAPELPPKQEQELLVELAPSHRALYDTVMQRERQKVLGLLEDLDRNRFTVFRSLTLLRMLSLAPGLIDPEHAHVPSSKLDELMVQLREVVAEGHRTVVFSQFTSFLTLVADRLDAEGIEHAYLDGSTRQRERVIDGFRTGDAPVFLISLKAGGFGLTLTEADYVFVLDPWWNPAAESQAVDRSHRIGQTRTVMVYRLIAAGTIEEKVMALQRRKARLFEAVLDDAALFGQSLEADDIRALLED